MAQPQSDDFHFENSTVGVEVPIFARVTRYLESGRASPNLAQNHFLIGIDTDAFAACLTKPQRKYFVTVLLAWLLCQERRTLTALLRRILEARSLSGLSRFFSRAPWSEQAVAHTWRQRFDAQVSSFARSGSPASLMNRRAELSGVLFQ